MKDEKIEIICPVCGAKADGLDNCPVCDSAVVIYGKFQTIMYTKQGWIKK